MNGESPARLQMRDQRPERHRERTQILSVRRARHDDRAARSGFQRLGMRHSADDTRRRVRTGSLSPRPLLACRDRLLSVNGELPEVAVGGAAEHAHAVGAERV